MAERVEIVINAKDQASGVLGNITGALGSMASIAGGILAAGAIQDIGRALLDLGKDSITAASDLNETWNKIGTIFGERGTGDITDFVNEIGTQLGQSKQQMLDAAATFGVFGKSAGLTDSSLSNFSADLVMLSSDLASFYNTSPEDAITAIGAALRGESEPIRRYGVLLDDMTLRQKALELGIISNTKKALTPQQKVLAANAVILDQTKDAQGDFMRTSDGLANSQRIIDAQFENLKTTLGGAFLPIVQKVSDLISSDLMPAGLDMINKFVLPAADAISQFTDKIFAVIDYLKGGGNLGMGVISYLFGADIASQIQGILDFLSPLTDAFSGLFSAFIDSGPMVMTSLQEMWDYLVNVFETVGPQLIDSLTGIVNTITEIWTTHGETIMGVITFLWETIVTVVAGAATLIVTVVEGAVILIQGIMDAFSLLLQGNWQAAWDRIVQTVAEIGLILLDWFYSFFEMVLGLVGTNLAEFNAVWQANLDMLIAIVTTWGTNTINYLRGLIIQFFTVGQQIVQGLWDGFRSKIDTLYNWLLEQFRRIRTMIDNIFEIGSPSKFMEQRGKWIMEGLANGINEGAAMPAAAMTAAGNTINNSFSLTLNEAGSRGNVVSDFALLQSLAGA